MSLSADATEADIRDVIIQITAQLDRLRDMDGMTLPPKYERRLGEQLRRHQNLRKVTRIRIAKELLPLLEAYLSEIEAELKVHKDNLVFDFLE